MIIAILPIELEIFRTRSTPKGTNLKILHTDIVRIQNVSQITSLAPRSILRKHIAINIISLDVLITDPRLSVIVISTEVTIYSIFGCNTVR